MFKNNYILAMLFILALAANNIYAQNSTDLASDTAYGDGFDDGDNGGINYLPWDVVLFTSGALDEAEALAQDATSVGGDASLNSGGRAFILRANEQSSAAASIGRRNFPSLIDGGKIRFRIQSVGDTGNSSAIGSLYNASGFAMMGVNTQGSFLTWVVTTTAPTNTGIPETSPIEVLITHNNSTTFDIEITELVAPFTVYSDSGVSYINSGAPTRLEFNSNPASGQELYCIFNNLLVNPDGLLPVGLSAFELE